ncbi:predicted protein [Naegleria gruberi]|uniref:Predicted protein n=1 Tax=Naegleria gruberi TaxID=5762 RepID=D2VFU5_NAEGR|nr:uncharacterized protein NAEGRDRAFT_49189 [Naegleria gruberi]EFC44142.1 predicted protein [Naegleria gruberi]|eukprot:XP_002676886.1 predicted protein [Naegleria gruberi strain NEG-M]
MVNQTIELFSYNPDPFLQPASNNKLLTTIAALNHLGSKFRFSTDFFYDYKNRRVVVRPKGDPTLTFEQLQKSLMNVLEKVTSMNPHEIVVDASFFNPIPFTNGGDDEEFPDSWEWGNLQYSFSSVPSALSLEHNTLTFTVKGGEVAGQGLSIVLDEPFQSFAKDFFEFDTSLSRTLDCSNANIISKESVTSYYKPLDNKIIVRGQLCAKKESKQTLTVLDTYGFFLQAVSSASASSNGPKSVKIDYLSEEERSSMFEFKEECVYSDNILTVMNTTLQESDNMYAELFLRQLGTFIKANSSLDVFPSITTRGIQVVKDILTSQFNLSPFTFFQNDGSGLSRHNLISPRSLVDALSAIYYKGAGGVSGETFVSLLPLGGRSGTLRNRFVDFPGIVSAKTGSLDGVSSLSGYIRNANYRDPIVFSIIVNQCPLSAKEMHQIIDSIVTLFAFMNPKC